MDSMKAAAPCLVSRATPTSKFFRESGTRDYTVSKRSRKLCNTLIAAGDFCDIDSKLRIYYEHVLWLGCGTPATLART